MKKEDLILDIMENLTVQKKIGIIHLEMVKESASLYGMSKFINPAVAAETVRPLFKNADREIIVVMSLNNALEPMAAEVVAVGGVDGCPVDVRNVFKHAILNNAVRILFFHNHLSGDPAPSEHDKRMTQRLSQCGAILGIEVADHIILGDDGTYYSLAEHGEVSVVEKGDIRI